MLRALIAGGIGLGLMALATAAPAQANCAAATTEALYASDRSCPEDIRKVSCDGSSVDLMAAKGACCKLRDTKSIKWRCGTDEALTFKCKGRGKDANFLSVRKTDAGLKFVCLGEKVVVVPEGPPDPPVVSGGGGGAGGSE